MTREDLQRYLAEQGVPVETWGTGKARTVEKLLEQIESGESVLYRDADGSLVDANIGSTIIVYYEENATRWRLIEEKQIYRDGRVRKRDLPVSVGEKMHPHEDPIEAAYRALKEELGITERLPLTPLPQQTKGPVASESFPGLVTIFTFYVFEVTLPAYLYKPEGYIEVQPDKTNYFVWVQC